ncbi:MAG: hypothetical protein IBX70_05815 [Clostridia bacterium]|nr:hypothetical protein [Clostridia bacterium]
MSAFLGPIHHWLYNKVLWHEALLEDIYEIIRTEGHDPDVIRHYTESLYGMPETSPLETVIDGGNIHGWLQTKIHSLEHRMAYAITKGIEKGYLNIDALKALYRENGGKAKAALGTTFETPDQAFKAIYDFMLEGMPCDRVNQPISNDEDGFVWQKRLCIHTDFWEAVEGDINVFNTLRLEWIDAFVSDAFNFDIMSDSQYKLSRRSA